MQPDEKKFHLNVPAYRQTKDYTCVPSCCKMILDYMNDVILTIPESDLSEDDIAKAMKTTVGGTQFPEVENINEVMALSNPSLEFIAEFKQHTLDEIKKEIRAGRPVSVWIDTGSVRYLHSVVITGFDDTMKTISYNDPTYGREDTISQSVFLSMWEQGRGSGLMIKTQIGRINRDTLEKFMPQELSNEQS